MNQVKNLLPHLFALLVMVALAFTFFAPFTFQGKVLHQHDNVQAKGAQTEIMKLKKETGKYPLWTNSNFAGMPAYQIYFSREGNYATIPFYLLILKQSVTAPHTACLLAMFCCYLLLIVLRIDWRLALAGAIVFGLSSYNMDLIQAGHSTKLITVAYMPLVLAGVVLIYRQRLLLGGGLFALAVALQFLANHLQITYYTFMVVGIIVLAQLIFAIKNKNLAPFAKATGVLVIATLLGIASNITQLWTTYEFSKESQRGKTELVKNREQTKPQEGLSKNYAFSYSYGIKETVSTFVQNYYGGGNEQNSIHESDYYRAAYPQYKDYMINQLKMDESDAARRARPQAAAAVYWGEGNSPGVAIYLGVIVVFLFIMSFFLGSWKEKSWMIASALFMLTIAWGGNFFLNHLWFDILPQFNKFRALSMAFGLVQCLVVAAAFWGLQRFFTKEIAIAKKRRALNISGIIMGGILLILLLGTFGNLGGGTDASIKALRSKLALNDTLRSILFLGLAFGALWLYINNKIKNTWAIVIIALLCLIDIWTVGKRVMYDGRYEEKKTEQAEVERYPADDIILQDDDIHYRVLDQTAGQGVFADSRASYFHKSIGGYSAAKLQKFQEVIPKLNNPRILGMLNTKYVINSKQRPARLPDALGNAWFIKEIKYVPTADAAFDALDQLNPRTTALIRENDKTYLEGFSVKTDSSAYIKLTAYHPDKLTYEYSTATEQLAVFSEVYYPPNKGWKVYLNGEKIEPFIKANYLLRAIRLPAGQKQVLEMRFEPAAFYQGKIFATLGSLGAMLIFLVGLGLFIYKNGLKNPSLIKEEALEERTPEIQKTKATTSKKSSSSPKYKKPRNK